MRLTEEQEMQAGHNGQGNDSHIFPKILPITFLPHGLQTMACNRVV